MTLQDKCLQFDPVSGACVLRESISASMTALNAFGSQFFNAMNNATHKDLMTPSELRLISEWLDIGAQYYNDPFLAPVN
jgi:inosine-uridine nucleoside N-ribohydrolase